MGAPVRITFRADSESYHLYRAGNADIGSPEVLLLVHGFLGGGEQFIPFMDQLSQNHPVLSVDLPGHANSPMFTDHRINPKRILKSFSKLLDRISVEFPGGIHLYGYSMGGRLSLRAALHHQKSLKSLILEGTSPGISDPEARKERRQEDKKRADAIRENYTGFLESWKKLPLFTGTKGVTGETDFQERLNGIQRGQNPENMAIWLEQFGAGRLESVWGDLDQLEIPVLLLNGKQDTKYAEINRKMMNLLTHAVHKEIVSAAHRAHIDNPMETARLVNQFLNYEKSER